MQASKKLKIESLILNHKVFIFDVDRTLLKVNGSFRFYFYLLLEGFFHPFSLIPTLYYFLRCRFLKMELGLLHQVIFERFLKGEKLCDLSNKAQLFFNQCLEKLIYQPCMKFLKEAQSKNSHVILLSSSPSFLIQPLAEKLSISHWIATEYSIDHEKKLTKILQLIDGPAKADVLEKIKKQFHAIENEIIVFSDSIVDLPLLEKVGSVVAVNPDRKLRKIAMKKNWYVL